MSERYDVLIVGAGHGGAHAATVLRQRKFEGTIAIVGDEPELPYERPPLSKEYFSGERSFERILIRPETFWAERHVTFHLGRRVMAIDAAAHQVLLDDGTTIAYGHLVWAAGGAARRLTCQGHDLGGVHAVRTRAHVDAMMAELENVTNVVVIGGGYIGLEAAAVLTKFGKHVTVLETMNRVLARVAGEALSRFYEGEHRAHGVEIRLGETASHLEGANGWVTGVQLVSGALLPAQMVIVGIGIIPSVGPLLDADAAGGNGVFVDEYCRTSLPDIFAIGDCAAHANHFAEGAIIRLESVQNATDQATTVAKAITGDLEPYHATPWFWSNQYDLKLQTVGLSTGFDETFTHGDPTTRKFSIVYLKNNHVLALDCVNNAKDFVQGKTVIGREARPRPEFTASGDPIKALAG